MNIRLRPLLPKLGIGLASLLALLAISEVLVRTLTDTRRPLLVVDEDVGRRYLDGFEGPYYSDESEREVHLRFNAHGLRFPDVPHEKPEGVRRLLLFGDSFVAGLEVEEAVTACAVLERRLALERPDERWEVLNFGVSGSAPDQELALYRHVGQLYQADLVLCTYFVGNDFGGVIERISRTVKLYYELDAAGELVQVPYPSPRIAFNELLNQYSRFYVWQKKLVNESSKRQLKTVVASFAAEGEGRNVFHGDSLRKSEWVYCTEVAGDVSASWDVTDAVLSAFAEEVEADGARFGLVIMPASLQLLDDDFAFVRELGDRQGVPLDPLHPNRRLAALCDRLGVPCVDLLPLLRSETPSHSYAAQDEWILFNGAGHLNERGHELFAEGVFQALSQELTAGL